MPLARRAQRVRTLRGRVGLIPGVFRMPGLRMSDLTKEQSWIWEVLLAALKLMVITMHPVAVCTKDAGQAALRDADACLITSCGQCAKERYNGNQSSTDRNTEKWTASTSCSSSRHP